MRIYYLKIFLTFLFLFFIKNGNISSQTYNIKGIKNIFKGFLYNIHEDDSLKKDSVLHYSMTLGKTVKGGFRLSQKLDNDWYLINDFSDNPIKKLDNGFQLYVGHCLYTENIKAYEILIQDENGKLFSKKFDVTTDKQQYPQNNCIEEWQYQLKQKGEKIDFPKSISKIGMHFYKEFENKSDFIILTDFCIYENKVDTVNIHHPFFDRLTGQNSMERLNYNSLSFDNEITSFSKYSLAEIASTNFYVSTDQKNNITIYRDIFGYLLKYYPFYSIKGIDKTAYLADFNNISSSVVSEEDYLVKLDSFFKILNDPHFYLMNIIKTKERDKEKLKMGPVRIFQIHEKYYVAACFDSTLLEKINPGNEIISIDGKNINNTVQEKMKEFRGNYGARHDKALSIILYKSKNDSTLLTYIANNGDTLRLTLYYYKNLQVPNNFKSNHNEYRCYVQEKILYIRLNHWQSFDYITFLNHLNEIDECIGIVFDLRNNSGGNGKETELIASCFLNKPTIVEHHVFDKLKESHVVFPNPKVNLTNKHVVILGNNRTACASEGFIALMKNNENVYFVSDNPTSGNFANRYELTFPSGIKCAINCLFTPHFKNYGIIEEKGIEPDIWVHLNSVNDLAPYGDKLLKTAFKLIDYWNH